MKESNPRLAWCHARASIAPIHAAFTRRLAAACVQPTSGTGSRTGQPHEAEPLTAACRENSVVSSLRFERRCLCGAGLSTRSVCRFHHEDGSWYSLLASNQRPPACKAGALPTELSERCRWRRIAVSIRSPPVDSRVRILLRQCATSFGASLWYRATPSGVSSRRFHLVSWGCKLAGDAGLAPARAAFRAQCRDYFGLSPSLENGTGIEPVSSA